MALYDATLPLKTGMAAFPGDPLFSMVPHCERSKGDPFDLALITMGTHTGTHVDPPAHYLEGGSTVDQIPLETLIGNAIVLDMRGKATVDRNSLEESPLSGQRRVLLKTDNGPMLLESQFSERYTHLTEDGARFLVEKGVCLVGTDYLSLERYRNPGAPVHRVLLEAGVLIVEGVNLINVPSGLCEMFCLPLLIKGADGAPARVIIRR